MSARIIRGDKSGSKLDKRGLGEFYFDSAHKHGDKICQLDAATGREESYRSVKERSTRVAIHLRNLGLKSEDVVLCCLKNTLDNIIPILSALYLGAKVASLDTSQSVKDCAHCISIVRAKYVFVEDQSLKLIEDSLIEAKLNSTIIVVGESVKYRTLQELLEFTPEENKFRPVTVKNCHETAFIYFSSGTSGLPKGICITHFGLLNSKKAVVVMLHFSSFYWISAAALTTTAFIKGGCRILASKFDAEEAFWIIQKYKVTTIFLAPIYTYYLMAVNNADKYDTSSLSRMIIGGSPLCENQLKKTRELFKHTFVSLMYGTTETHGCITAFDYTKNRHGTDKCGSSGKCVNDTEIKIVDIESRELLGPNQKGEICVRSPYLSPGYYNDPTRIYDTDNFVKTGDIGYYDEDEYIYVVDRIKEMFKYKSWHVVPTSLEAVLQEHPCVKEAAVFGIPHDVDEFWPAACVTLKDGSEITAEEIDAFFTGRVAGWQKLRGGIKIVETLPKTPSGKLQRWKIKKMLLAVEDYS
ncbi:4-coumarate--CoA ligase 1-like isoform X2 [Anoplophora glabripennis]|uniref:4-coumarate--CoA ligase 1-like isoform X2 n=1 Tax=Anoplophora glabripennis TaxID=217634 RepID=UPI0008737A47|nr:4-coumarate--CoA ligase 1-like isoform X2 [Anoplophora glabripennis]